jgi:hypothetical protein
MHYYKSWIILLANLIQKNQIVTFVELINESYLTSQF